MRKGLIAVALAVAVGLAGTAFARPPAYCYYTSCDVITGANGTYVVCGTTFVC